MKTPTQKKTGMRCVGDGEDESLLKNPAKGGTADQREHSR